MDTEKKKSPHLEYDSEFSTFNSNDDKVVFVPTEDICVIERVLDDWETVKREWKKLSVDS